VVWAASPGVLGGPGAAGRGGWPAETTRVVGGNPPRVFASKSMLILMSFFGRLGLGFGSVWGSLLAHFRPFVGPSWCQDPLRTVLSSKRRIFTKHYVFQWFGAFFRPRWRAKTTQDRSKTGPRSSWIGFFGLLLFRLDFGSLSARFWCRLGCPNGAQGLPPNWGFRPLGPSWCGPFFILWFGFAFLVLLGSSWARVGCVWGAKFGFLGRFGAFLGSFLQDRKVELRYV